MTTRFPTRLPQPPEHCDQVKHQHGRREGGAEGKKVLFGSAASRVEILRVAVPPPFPRFSHSTTSPTRMTPRKGCADKTACPEEDPTAGVDSDLSCLRCASCSFAGPGGQMPCGPGNGLGYCNTAAVLEFALPALHWESSSRLPADFPIALFLPSEAAVSSQLGVPS